jgi:hypothetical protein
LPDFIAWIRMGRPIHARGIGRGARQEGHQFLRRTQILVVSTGERSRASAVKQASWPASPIDRFLLARLEEKNLEPASPADKRTLIRRATFDLTGLPPSPREVEDFLADPSPLAFAKVVDRLLASPQYGERWARHWLDLVRYAETNGHEFDNDKIDAWRYRDYVIRAFNEDVPLQPVREGAHRRRPCFRKSA